MLKTAEYYMKFVMLQQFQIPHTVFKICFEEPSEYGLMDDDVRYHHELSMVWRTNMNDANLYQHNVFILNGK